jgi:hypothetical protein
MNLVWKIPPVENFKSNYLLYADCKKIHDLGKYFEDGSGAGMKKKNIRLIIFNFDNWYDLLFIRSNLLFKPALFDISSWFWF